MNKFGRTYRVTIDLGDGGDPIVIGMPLTCQFTVNRSLNSSLNVATIEIYNLGKKVRDLIFQEFFGSERKKTITLEAGYGGVLSTLFKGSIFEAYSYRDGTDIKTVIESRSGSWEVNSSTVYTTLAKNTTVKDVLTYLAGQTGLEIGGIGDYPDVMLRPIVLNGRTYEYIKQYSNNDVYVDNDKLYILRRNEALEGQLAVIDKDTGILQTPRREGAYLNVSLLFEPRLIIGQYVSLKSSIAPIYDGVWRVDGLQHTGVISEAVGGQCQTMVDLFLGSKSFKVVQSGQ